MSVRVPRDLLDRVYVSLKDAEVHRNKARKPVPSPVDRCPGKNFGCKGAKCPKMHDEEEMKIPYASFHEDAYGRLSVNIRLPFTLGFKFLANSADGINRVLPQPVLFRDDDGHQWSLFNFIPTEMQQVNETAIAEVIFMQGYFDQETSKNYGVVQVTGRVLPTLAVQFASIEESMAMIMTGQNSVTPGEVMLTNLAQHDAGETTWWMSPQQPEEWGKKAVEKLQRQSKGKVAIIFEPPLASINFSVFSWTGSHGVLTLSTHTHTPVRSSYTNTLTHTLTEKLSYDIYRSG
jgi:hypothetical protein